MKVSELTVVHDMDGDGGLHQVSLGEVIYLEYIRSSSPHIVVHRLQDQFYIWGSLKVWARALQDSGFDFYPVDRNLLINIRNIKRLDEKYKKAYFEYDITKDSKSCTMAMEKYKAVTELMRAWNQPFIEVTPRDNKDSILEKITRATSLA